MHISLNVLRRTGSLNLHRLPQRPQAPSTSTGSLNRHRLPQPPQAARTAKSTRTFHRHVSKKEKRRLHKWRKQPSVARLLKSNSTIPFHLYSATKMRNSICQAKKRHFSLLMQRGANKQTNNQSVNPKMPLRRSVAETEHTNLESNFSSAFSHAFPNILLFLQLLTPIFF